MIKKHIREDYQTSGDGEGGSEHFTIHLNKENIKTVNNEERDKSFVFSESRFCC